MQDRERRWVRWQRESKWRKRGRELPLEKEHTGASIQLIFLFFSPIKINLRASVAGNLARSAGWTHKHHFVYRFLALIVARLTSAVMWCQRSRWILLHNLE
ncbi:hypothetical protein XENOCAPTIV_019131 [Xenoophorus captivus]|uniref:Uncharacterized protein n=1 Tax=Xenoophorus captivus TaxID=1517983 RepID=A0ABV0RUL3_9TELE